jgi:hypothetical protein
VAQATARLEAALSNERLVAAIQELEASFTSKLRTFIQGPLPLPPLIFVCAVDFTTIKTWITQFLLIFVCAVDLAALASTFTRPELQFRGIVGNLIHAFLVVFGVIVFVFAVKRPCCF